MVPRRLRPATPRQGLKLMSLNPLNLLHSLRHFFRTMWKKSSRRLLHWRMSGKDEAERFTAERKLRGKEQYLLDRIDDKEREIADLRQELRDQVQLKEKGLTELAEMQSKRRLHEEKCQSEVSAAKTEVDLAKRTIKDLEAQVCARLRVGLFCHNLGLFCPIM